MTNKSIIKLITSALTLALSVSACGTSNSAFIPLEQTNALTSVSSVDSSIIDQIQANTIGQTDWGTQVNILPSVKETKKVTFLSYLAFDNDKGGYRDELKPTLNLYEAAGSSNILNIVMQTDGAEDNDGKRYFILNDSDNTKIVSPYTQFSNELDSADFKVLQSFVRWGFSNYKSQVKILTIDNHGGAFMGIARDDTSQSLISLPNLSRAIKASAGKLDILNFDACMMSSFEVGYELKDVADVMIGSEDSTLSTGMLFANSLSQIIANSSNNDELAKGILLSSDRFGKDFTKRPNQKKKVPNVYTISAFRGSEMKNVSNELNNLAKLLLSRPNLKQAAKVAINGTHTLLVDGDDFGQRDLYEVLQRLNTIITDPDLKNAVLRTRNSLNKAIILSRSHNAEKYAQGMAINISPVSVQSPEYQATAFAKDTLWDEFILAINK